MMSDAQRYQIKHFFIFAITTNGMIGVFKNRKRLEAFQHSIPIRNSMPVIIRLISVKPQIFCFAHNNMNNILHVAVNQQKPGTNTLKSKAKSSY